MTRAQRRANAKAAYRRGWEEIVKVAGQLHLLTTSLAVGEDVVARPLRDLERMGRADAVCHILSRLPHRALSPDEISERLGFPPESP